MKIIHVAELVKGGVATILNELVSSQSKIDDVDVQVLVNEVHVKYVNCNNTSTYSGSRNVIGLLRFAIAIIKIYLKEKPEVMHLHSSFSGFVGRIVLIPFRVEIIYHPHGISFDSERVTGFKRKLLASVERVLSFNCSKIIAISAYEYEELAKELPVDKLYLVPNGVRDIKSTIKQERNGKLLFVGRFDQQKGLDLILDFYKKSATKYPLDIIGASVLNTESNQNTINNVTYLGWKTPEQLEQLFGDYSAVIMPSRWEGFGLVAIEALRSGTPVICSNRGALPYIIKDEVNGFVFDLSNIETSLKIALHKFERADLKVLIANSRQTYTSQFTSAEMCEKVFLTYI